MIESAVELYEESGDRPGESGDTPINRKSLEGGNPPSGGGGKPPLLLPPPLALGGVEILGLSSSPLRLLDNSICC